MKKIIYILVACAGLLLVFIPAVLHFNGSIANEHMKNLMFLGTLLWFAGAVPWLGKKSQEP